jgi:hypothetical protein
LDITFLKLSIVGLEKKLNLNVSVEFLSEVFSIQSWGKKTNSAISARKNQKKILKPGVGRNREAREAGPLAW